jgi:polyferredoxin
MKRIDLLRFSTLRALLVGRWSQLLLRAVLLAGFLFTTLAGFSGSVVGSHNFAIIFVWIAWWTLLKLIFIPFGGRSWCSVCPLPLAGEWFQQGGLLNAGPARHGLGWRLPRRLRGVWVQAVIFLFIGFFVAVTLTTARVTAWILAGILVAALLLALVFERRTFCSTLCPIGGFIGLYARAAPVELRIKDRQVCAQHDEKLCYTHCSWGIYPVALKSSAPCGLCMECVRACPHDNIALNLRPFGSDLHAVARPGLDDAFLALVMLGTALVYSTLFSGPWGELKTAAYALGSAGWLFYAAALLVVTLILLPGLYLLAVWLGQLLAAQRISLRKAARQQTNTLVPLGLMAWITFTISFAFSKYNYVLTVISDPMGWGWNLFGTANLAVKADLSGISLFLQAAALLVGLFWSARVASRHAATLRSALPLTIFCLLFTLAMAWLLLG